MAGVNAELRPLVRMTFPPHAARIGPDFTSTILLLGLLPIDRHRLHLDAIEPPRRFAERSSTLVHRVWRHERTLEPDGAGGTVLTDRVAFDARVPFPRAAIALVFAHRHRRLRRAFGAR
jgi:ligand-binding SRPBCC domain-containing protein